MSMTIESAADAAKIYQQLLDATENVQGKAEVTDDGKVAVTIQKADGTSTVLVVEVPDLDVPATDLEGVGYEEIAQKLESVLSEGLGLSQEELQEVMKNIENLVDAMVEKGLPGTTKKGVLFDIYQVMALLAQVAIEQKKAAMLLIKAENAQVLRTMASEIDESIFNARLGLGLTIGTTVLQTGATSVMSVLQGKAGAAQLDEMTNSGVDVVRRMETQGNVIDNPDSLAAAELKAMSRLNKLSGADVANVNDQFASPEADARVQKHGEFNNQIDEKRELLNAEKTALDADKGQLEGAKSRLAAKVPQIKAEVRTEIKALEAELGELDPEYKGLNDELSEIDGRRETFISNNNRVSVLAEDVESLNTEIQNLQGGDAGQLNEKVAMRDEKAAALEQAKKAAGELFDKSAGKEGKEARLEQIIQQSNDLMRKISAKEADLKMLDDLSKVQDTDFVKGKTEALETKKGEVNQLKQSLDEMDNEIRDKEAEAQDLKSRIEDPDAIYFEGEDPEAELDNLNQEIGELKQRRNELPESIQTKEGEIKNLEREVDGLMEVSGHEAKVAEGAKKVEDLKGEIANLEQNRKNFFDEGMGRVNNGRNPLDAKCMDVAKAEEVLQDARAEVRRVNRADVQKEFKQEYHQKLEEANKTLQVRDPNQPEAPAREMKLSELVAEGKQTWGNLTPEEKAQLGNPDEAAFVRKYVMDRVNTQEPPALSEEDFANYNNLAKQGEEGYVKAKVDAAEQKVKDAELELAKAKEEVVKAANDAFGKARAEFDDVHNRYKEAQARGNVPDDLMKEHKLAAAKMEYANIKRLKVVSEYGTPEQKLAIKQELKGMHDRIQGEMGSNLELMKARTDEQKWRSRIDILNGLSQGVHGAIQQGMSIRDASTRTYKIEEEALRQKIEQSKMVRDDADAMLRDLVQLLRGVVEDNSQMMNRLSNF